MADELMEVEKEEAAAVEVVPYTPFSFRKHIPAKDSRHLFKLFSDMDIDDAMTVVPIAVKMVESWDFEGDPSDPDAYESLDLFAMLRLYGAITREFNARLKN